MKKKSTSRSAFFNLRVLIGLFVGMTGISLALLAANPFGQKNSLSAAQLALIQQKYGVASSSIDPLVPAAIDCSRIKQLGIDKQENLRAGAIMIFCGLSEGGKASHGKAFSKLAKKLLSPLAFGSTDVDLITGAESFPNVTQSETFTTANPDNPNQIVVADRESGWADNNPSSPFFGSLYISWNDFNVGNANIFVIRSTDGGTTWSSPVMVSTQPTFIRNTQITGDLGGNGTIYIAGMDEGGGGFPHNDTNLIFKSTDGGATWSNTYTGTPFPGPGVGAVGYFAVMFTDFGGYWRHEGWGEPAAFNNVVDLVYAQHGTGSDAGDVYYIRSTDGGVTFGAPLKLNTDSTTRPQWQPNLSVSPTGTVFATWYDARESTSCTKGNPSVPCYRMWSRKSNDNGATWLPDDTLSDVVSPLPGQSDPNIVAGYAGDYDYGSAILTKHVTSWDDGRVAIGGASQQDTFTDRELVGFAVTTSDPACNSIINTQATDFVINLSDAVDPATVDATDFTVNGIPADSFTLSNGNTTITFHFNS